MAGQEFTDAELHAARLRLATFRATMAFREFVAAWETAGRNIRAVRQARRQAREARMVAAEIYVSERS